MLVSLRNMRNLTETPCALEHIISFCVLRRWLEGLDLLLAGFHLGIRLGSVHVVGWLLGTVVEVTAWRDA
jgi:hypothetical protein